MFTNDSVIYLSAHFVTNVKYFQNFYVRIEIQDKALFLHLRFRNLNFLKTHEYFLENIFKT